MGNAFDQSDLEKAHTREHERMNCANAKMEAGGQKHLLHDVASAVCSCVDVGVLGSVEIVNKSFRGQHGPVTALRFRLLRFMTDTMHPTQSKAILQKY